MTNWGFSSNWPRKVRRLASAVANGRPATRTLRNSGWVIVPSGATTKSPLNSGLRHTSMRTESPGVSTDCALRAGGLLGGGREREDEHGRTRDWRSGCA